MNVALVVGGITSNASGLVPAIGGLARSLSHQGQSITIFTVACKRREQINFGLDGASVGYCAAPGIWLGRTSYSPALRRILDEKIAGIDVLHNHSVWVLPNHYASTAARVHKKPILTSLHGVLEPWALHHSAWKKRLASVCFQNRNFASDACIHALNPQEVTGIRAYGLRQPVAVIPNGVDLASLAGAPSRDILDERIPRVKGRRIVLFLARLHPKKGLSHLIPAWSNVAKEYPDWHLLLAGPDDGQESAIRHMVREFGLDESVSFAGSLVGGAKLAALAGSEIFILPSFSEGFSLAILEAMACGLPILLTPGCNFPEVQRAGAGFEMESTVADTERGLRTMLGLSENERRQMGSRGRALIEQHYTWDRVAGQMSTVYQWIVNGGAVPACVRID